MDEVNEGATTPDTGDIKLRNKALELEGNKSENGSRNMSNGKPKLSQ